MKFLKYSDLHNRRERIFDVKRVLDAIYRLAKEYEVDYVINLGDTFHTRGLISTSCFDLLERHYAKWAKDGIKQIILIGNHDQEDVEGKIHPMNTFRQYPGWYVIDEPTFIGSVYMLFIPYMENLSKETIDIFAPKSKEVPVDAVLHAGICGARRNDTNVDSTGIPINWLEPFRRVFCGHYHLRQEFQNVQYVGSPMQQDFAEMGQKKGVLICDNETHEINFVEIEGTRRHFEVKVWWEDNKRKIALPKGIENNDAVIFRVEGDEEVVKAFDPNVVEIKASHVQIDRQIVEKSFSRLGIERKDIHNTANLMDRYVDHVETDLSKERLKDVGRSLIGTSSA